MKKIYALLAVFLCVGMIAPVYGASIEQAYTDSWGRTCLFDNGDAIYFGQTVAVTNSSIACNYEYEVFENCTVTIKTNGHVVVVDENGDPIISKNGFEFHYTSNWRFILTGMTWNNFPRAGGEPTFDTTDVEVIAKSAFEYLNAHYKSNQKSLLVLLKNNGIDVTDASGNQFNMKSAGDIQILGDKKTASKNDISGTVTGNGYNATFIIKYGNSTVKYGTIIESVEMNGSDKVTITTDTGTRITVFTVEEEEFSNFEVIDFETEGEAGFEMGVRTIKGAHSPDEYMIVQKGTWTSKDVKAHAEAKGVEYVYVFQFP